MKFTRCLRCMQVVEHYPCPYCGYDPGTVPAQPHALRPGSILNGKYVVGAILGQGGFGITYIGWDLALESKVAIKEYFPSGQVVRSPENSLTLQWYTTPQAEAARNAGREMFLKEARKMSRVGNIPQVVRVRDLFQENDTAYIVMDFVEGETLMARLKKTGPLSWAQAREIFLPAIRAMEQVHQEGLIHRDLSPDNLMLLPNGDVRILDLGAAKDLTINSGASSMQVAKGGFSPLEQYTQRGGSGTWSDVYAMAATMYYSLTGVLPPTSVDRVETDGIRWDLPGLTALPKPVLEALKKAMAVFVKDRTQTMGALLSALEPRKTPTKAAKKAQKKSSVPKLLLILLVVALVSFGVWKFVIPQETTPDPQLAVESLPTETETLPVQTDETEETVPEETFDLSPYTGYARPYRTYYHGDDTTSEIYSVTSYDLGNGQTKFVAEIQARSGDTISARIFTTDGEPFFEWSCPAQATGKKQTIAFDIPTDILDNTWWVCLDIGTCTAEISHTDIAMYLTDGNPIGEKMELPTTFDRGHYQCHSLTSQKLDNDHIRFTMDFTVPAGLRLGFSHFGLDNNWFGPNIMSSNVTVEGRQTFVWDVPVEFFADAALCCVSPEDWDAHELENDAIYLNPPFWQ